MPYSFSALPRYSTPTDSIKISKKELYDINRFIIKYRSLKEYCKTLEEINKNQDSVFLQLKKLNNLKDSKIEKIKTVSDNLLENSMELENESIKHKAEIKRLKKERNFMGVLIVLILIMILI